LTPFLRKGNAAGQDEAIPAQRAAERKFLDKQGELLYHAKYLIVEPPMNISPIKQPSAWIPLAMSLTALAEVLVHAAIFGVVHEADEGAAAHIWQILIAGQIPPAVFFVIKWIPRATKQALIVLAILAGLLLANFAAVYFLT
jgi:hypothetical protein